MRKPSSASGSERSAVAICPEAPYPTVGGGPLRTASLLEYLARRYALDVILFREPGASDPRAAFPAGVAREFHVIDLPHHSPHVPARFGRNLLRFVRGRAPLNDRFDGFEVRIGRALAGHRYDLALIEHFWCAPYVEQVSAHAARTVLDLHNIESAYYSRLGASAAWLPGLPFARFAAGARALESRWLPRFESVLVASNEDAARVREIAPGVAARVYPNAIPRVPQPDVVERDAIVFSGNLGYPPNIAAVRFFRREIWPVLRERRPELVWRIVGKNEHGVARYVSGDARIELTGPVENAIEQLASARLAVVPLLAGSGTRMKILEAWAAGRAVVSTRLGAEGLPARDGEHLLLADADYSFADAVLHLLDEPEERNRIGAAGRAFYETCCTWDRVWDVLTDLEI